MKNMVSLSPLHVLDDLKPSIQRSREAFHQTLDSLPAPCRKVLQDCYQSRLVRSETRPMLGEYAPILIAEILQVQDSSAWCQISVAWQQICWGILVLDDVIDGELKSDRAVALVASQLVVQRGVCALLAHSKNIGLLRSTIDNAFQRNATAIAFEQQHHRSSVAEYTNRELGQLGDKLALLEICVDAIGDQVDAPSENRSHLREALKHLVSGLQLLDDLTDVNEDLAAQNMTFPLTFWARSLESSISFANPLASDELLEQIILVGALASTLDHARAALVSGLRELTTLDPDATTRTVQYVQSLIQAIDFASSSIKDCRARLTVAVEPQDSAGENGRLAHRRGALEQARRALTIVAQTS